MRPDDLLTLKFEFQNLSPVDEGTAKARLIRDSLGSDALIIVHFPPQSIVEEAFPENENSEIDQQSSGTTASAPLSGANGHQILLPIL